MNYPNKIKKNNNKFITYANRGMTLEELINKTNDYYIETDQAIIYKKPTPIGIVKSDYKNITKAYFKAPSTLDYNGIYKGCYIEFDAKETKQKTSFPLKNIHDHQLVHMRRIINHGGICFLIILMNNEIYYLDGKDLFSFIDSEKRKSIPFSYFEEKAILLKENYLKGINYLEAIDKIYKGEKYEN